MEINKISEDRAFQKYFSYSANFDQSWQSHRQKKDMQHLEKKYTANFAFYPLLFRVLASQNITRNKGDEVGNRTGYKKKGKRKKERAKQKSNWNRKKTKQSFGLSARAKN